MRLCENKVAGGDVGGRPCLLDGVWRLHRGLTDPHSRKQKGTDLIRASSEDELRWSREGRRGYWGDVEDQGESALGWERKDGSW